ncbi:MAG: DUF3488 domain-containing protein [Kouleothrix sp.]|nr:DUF3488 domain-containing protein [Kouleothrix sp.]
MLTLLEILARRFRPRIGWLLFVPALAAALCPAIAASDSKMELPVGIFSWAGLLGLPLGLWFGREPSAGDRPPSPRRGLRLALFALRLLLQLAIVLGVGALLLVAAGRALPPFGLVAQDLAALLGWAEAVLRRAAGWGALPEGRSWGYLAVSLPRFWLALQAAPNAGERGALLLVSAAGVATSWLGALALGWALARRRNLFGWSLPLLGAIALTAILNAGSGATLIIGLALLLLLTVAAGVARRQLAWERSGADYSDELRLDILSWAAGLVVALMSIAALLPTSISNPLADLLWRDVELPSGIAVLERNIPRPRTVPKVDVGLSTLPWLELGQSLEQPPPSEVVMRVRLAAPLAPSPWPRYWRARVFNLYNGRQWSTNARVGEFPSSAPAADSLPGAIVQQIEDLRRDRAIVVGLPDVLAIDIGVRAERLPDGALAALTQPTAQSQQQSYRVFSRPQELASPPAPDGPPPDLQGYLGLPRSYSPRVSDLARVVVGASAKPYDQALALETYLRALPYSYEVRPIPGGGDAVEQFLFDMRQGYCTYYASAMAVMARTLGIPARVAIGYATGAYDQAAGAYLIHQSDAHAWPELYIDGRWLPFEPTPVRALPARNIPEAAPPILATAPAEQPSRLTGPLIWAAVLAIVALLSYVGIRLGRPRPAGALVTWVQQRLERAGKRAGIAWPAGATLHEYGRLLQPRAGDAGAALDEVVDLVEQARYSGRPLRGDQEGRLRAAAERVLARLGRRR